MSIPDAEGNEKQISIDGKGVIIPGGFKNPLNFVFNEPDGIEYIVLREIERDYRLDECGLTKDSLVIDIGAHVGVVSMYLSKKYGCRVLAYEPEGGNCERLIRNIETNGLGGLIRAWQLAVTGDGREVTISKDDVNSGGGNIYAEGGETVNSVTLKDIMELIADKEIDLLKVDCEGAEYEIFEDLEPLKRVRAIRGEFHRGFGDAEKLLERVRAAVPDTVVTMQGTPPANKRAQRVALKEVEISNIPLRPNGPAGKLRIHWLACAPWTAVGYGNQTKIFVPRLKTAGHEISITALYGLEGAPLHWGDVKVYPKGFHLYGQDIAAANAGIEKADILISLLDAWVCEPDMLAMNKQRWVPWFPVDSEPLAASIRENVARAYKRIVFSQFAERMMEQAGLDYYYVPHGIDTKKFTPKDRAESRKMLGLPEDAYIVGMVAANKGNPSRKCFCEQIAAFQTLRMAHKDAVMYLHTYDGSSGAHGAVNLVEYIKGLDLKLGKEIYICNQHMYHLSYGDTYMAAAYSAMDVLTNVSAGEGFGIPIVEAQACGTPVIVGDWTSMSELCFSGRKVRKEEAAPFYTGIGVFQFVPRIESIASLMLAEYEHPHSREKAREGVLAYEADLVVEKYWEPVLMDIGRCIEEGASKLELVRF
jgi:FkbM family methyltransferase